MKSTDRTRAAKSVRANGGQDTASQHESWHGSPTSTPQASDSGKVHLTPREMQVLALMCQGLSNKVIGRHLKIAPSTVKVHVSKILRTLNVSTRLQAILVTNCSHILDQPMKHSEHGAVTGRRPGH